ncbi:XRE family transcriptional regulator [Marinobacteraceae bacterium S3BR75-40.1]
MRYLKNFNRRLRELRDREQLTEADIARICNVDEPVVHLWESRDRANQAFPTIDQLLDLCFRTGTPLDRWLDFDEMPDGCQLELPGLGSTEEADLAPLLDELGRALQRLTPTEDERELLKRYRESSEENRRLILQLMR